MSKILLLGSQQMFLPNQARNSQHELIRYSDYRYPYNFERLLQKMWSPLEGVSLFQSLIPEEIKLIHSFNAIPYTSKPYLITFESSLPRTIGKYNKQLAEITRDQLNSANCKKIIAMSNYAKERFIKQNINWSSLESIKKKLMVVYPNFPQQIIQPQKYRKGEKFKIIFVGNDFARKGGIVVLRLAKLADRLNLPLKINLVSRLNYGSKVYTDSLNRSDYQADLELLKLPNISLSKNLTNQQVIQLLKKSHLQLVCSLDDTYGYSILEGFSVGIPAITTNVCALPEFVNSNNGFVIDLKLNELKRWKYLSERKTKDYWNFLDRVYNYLAERSLNIIVNLIESPENYERISTGAINTASLHNSQKANILFDNLYSEISN